MPITRGMTIILKSLFIGKFISMYINIYTRLKGMYYTDLFSELFFN